MQQLINTLVGAAIKVISDTFSDDTEKQSDYNGGTQLDVQKVKKFKFGEARLNLGRNVE
jgi:hypothetical protein